MKDVKAIVGTAGHIDHGKSALVRALTGIETDRLPEERERGISIELGFAHLDLAGLGRVGVVDVPGHERFIRQMLAGAHGFDLVLVVVAADDGVMPQTEEHFDIVHLLGVRRAIFVISKTDLATPARVDDVREEIEILAAGTRFEDAPVVEVSARTGQGTEGLRACIAASLADLEPRPDQGWLRIPVDRVFVMKGHGVVVTGTALAGKVSVGDEIVVLPDPADIAVTSGGGDAAERRGRSGGLRARVREIQVHGEAVASAGAGQRVALNLSGLDKDDVARGETVAAPGNDATTYRFDARIEIRPAAGRALASHTRVRVHHGTRETIARLVWLDGVREVAPRYSGYGQLALAEPLVAVAGDRFVIRDETASRTLGGGVVLLAHAEKHRRSQGDIVPALEVLEDGDDARRLHAALALAANPAVEPAQAAAAIGVPVAALAAILKSGAGVVALGDATAPQFLIARERLDAFLARIGDEVASFEAGHPNLPGVDLEHLRGSVRPVLEARLFRLLIERLIEAGKMRRRANVVHTSGHAASLSGSDEAMATRMLARIVGASVMPPTLKELAVELGSDPARMLKLAAVLVLRGELVKVSAELFYSRECLDAIRVRLEDYLHVAGEITAAGFRDLIAASRKYGIPLLDWFDREGVTIRVGDVRKLRRT